MWAFGLAIRFALPFYLKNLKAASKLLPPAVRIFILDEGFAVSDESSANWWI
jgi:hypothetical protein